MATNSMWGQPPRLTTDASGNTVLRGVDGDLPFFGKPAESFGFSQLKTAAQNAAALANAIAGGGLVSVVTPGEYLCNLVTLPSNTELSLYLGAGVNIKLADGANSPLFVNAAYTTHMLGGGDTVTITSSGNVATVAWPGHGRSVRDYVWILKADQPEYNGVWPVSTVPDADSLTFKINADSAVTPATGTIKAGIADRDIKIWGEGTLDGNSANQTFSGDGPGKNLVNLMNVARSDFRLKHVKNQSRYGVFFSNSLNSGGGDVDFYSTTLGQDGFHISGPQRGHCVIDNITGQCGDDLVSLMTGDITAWGVPYGDTENIVVRNVNCEGGLTAIVKIDGAPVAGTTHRNIELHGISGVAPGAGIMAMVYAPGALQTYTIKRLVATDLNFDMKSSAPMMTINNGITVDHASIAGVRAAFTGKGAAAVFRNFGSTVNTLNVRDVKATGMGHTSSAIVDMDSTAVYGMVNMSDVESTGDTNGFLFRADGLLTGLRMNNVHKSGGGAIARINAGCTSTPVIDLDNARQGIAAAGFVADASTILNTNNFRSISGAAMVTVTAGTTLTWTGNASNSAGTMLSNAGTAKVNGPTLRVDVTTIARVDGAMVYNTNAAAGTLGVAGLVVCQGTAAGSWHLMSDPTLVY